MTMDLENYEFDVATSNNLLNPANIDKKDLDNESDFGQFMNDEDDDSVHDYYSHYKNDYERSDFLSRQTQRRNKKLRSYVEDEYSDEEDYSGKRTDFDGENYTISNTPYNNNKTHSVVDKLIKNIRRFFPPSDKERKNRNMETLSPRNSQMRSYCFSDTKMGRTYEDIMNERAESEKEKHSVRRRVKSVVMASDVKQDEDPPMLQKRKKSIAPNGGFFLKHPLENAVYNNEMEDDEPHQKFGKRKKSIAPNSGHFLRHPVEIDEDDELSGDTPDVMSKVEESRDVLSSAEGNRDTYLLPDNVVPKKSILRNSTSPKVTDRSSAYHSIFINPDVAEIPKPDYDEDETYEIDFGDEVQPHDENAQVDETFKDVFPPNYDNNNNNYEDSRGSKLNNAKDSLKKGLQRTSIDLLDEAPKPPPFRDDNMKVFRSSNAQPESKSINNMNIFSTAFKKVSSYINQKKEKNWVSE